MATAVRNFAAGFKLQRLAPADSIEPYAGSADSSGMIEKLDSPASPAEKGASAPVEDSGETESISRREEDTGLRRDFNHFHVQMIAFGGAIGTGLLIASGGVYSSGGAGFLILDYILVATMLLAVVMCMCELSCMFPVAGTFGTLGSRFVAGSWGFSMGWMYMLQWSVTTPLQIASCSIVITFWDPNQTISPAVWVTIIWVAILILNLFGVRLYGHMEILMSTIKIMLVIGVIICGSIISAGRAPNHEHIGAAYWKPELAFLNGFKGFCSVFVSAAFSLAGTELIALAAAEATHPRASIPKACRQVWMRVCLMYIVMLFVITLCVSPKDPRLTEYGSSNPRSSPIVVAILDAKIKVLPSIVNAVILLACISVGVTSVYGTSRTLLGLGQAGQAPKIFSYVDREGRPLPAIMFAMLVALIGYVAVSGSEGDVFSWLLAVSGLATIFTWFSICLCHIRFRQAWAHAGRPVELIPWRAPGGVYTAMYGGGFCLVILILQLIIAIAPIGADSMSGSDRAVTFFEAYLALPIFVLFIIYSELDWASIKSPWVAKRVKGIPVGWGPQNWWIRSWVAVEDIDIDLGRREMPTLEELTAEREERRQTPLWQRVREFFF